MNSRQTSMANESCEWVTSYCLDRKVMFLSLLGRHSSSCIAWGYGSNLSAWCTNWWWLCNDIGCVLLTFKRSVNETGILSWYLWHMLMILQTICSHLFLPCFPGLMACKIMQTAPSTSPTSCRDDPKVIQNSAHLQIHH